MSFSRFQLGFTRNRKVFNLSDAAFRLYVTCIDWSRDQKTDGLVTLADFPLIPHAPKGKRADALIKELVDAHLWDVVSGGWQIHDFLDWQDSAVQANERARRARERMRDVRANGRQVFARTEDERSLEVRDGPSDPPLISDPISDPDPDLPESSGSPGARGAAEGRAKKQRKPPMIRLPEAFEVTGKHLEYAKSKGWPEWWLRNRHEQFCDLAGSKGWLYANWDLAFFTYLRGEIGYRRGPEDLAHLAPRSPAAESTAARRERERVEADRAAQRARDAAEAARLGLTRGGRPQALLEGIGDG